jgi:hypothetical protein
MFNKNQIKMEKQVLFSEKQNQTMKWIWFLLNILALVFIVAAVQQIVFNKPFGTNPAPDWAYLLILFIISFFHYMLWSSNLKTEITDEHISFEYRPFIRKPRVIKWDDVDNCYVRIYSPIKEYGGWGWRTAFTRDGGKAYNVKGKIGIQLELKNGKNILIGTQKSKEAEKALKSIKSIKS